jgi:hypothetical protein
MLDTDPILRLAGGMVKGMAFPSGGETAGLPGAARFTPASGRRRTSAARAKWPFEG